MSEGRDLEKPHIEDNWADIVSIAPNERTPRSEDVEKIRSVSAALKNKGVEIPEWIRRDFSDPALYSSLPEYIRNNQDLLSSYLENTAKFDKVVHVERQKRWSGDESGLFGAEVSIPASLHANGRERRAESGYRVNIDYLRTIDIDPKRVLFYRVTQPSDAPKPEYYWTSDFHETVAGLQAETGGEYRKTAVILAADLQTISENGGLIQDINDDQGLPVRQVGLGPFDQKKALAVFRPDDFKKIETVRSELGKLPAKK